MSSDYLARRRARHEEATPSPWKCIKLYGTTQPGSFVWHVANMWNREADHEFAAHARNDEAATLDVLDAALAWRDSKAELNAAYVHEDEEAYDAAWWAHDDAELRLIAALDALEGEGEPADG